MPDELENSELRNILEITENQFTGFYREEEISTNGYEIGSIIKKYVSTSRAGVSTFVFKRYLEDNEKLLLTFKNLTENAEFMYMLSDNDLSISNDILQEMSWNGSNITNNLNIENTSNKRFLYISFRIGMGQESAVVEDIRLKQIN